MQELHEEEFERAKLFSLWKLPQNKESDIYL